MECMMQQWIRK